MPYAYYYNIFLTPPLESAPAKRMRPYLGPLDEVSALRLGAAVAMAPLRASGRQRHLAAKST